MADSSEDIYSELGDDTLWPADDPPSQPHPFPTPASHTAKPIAPRRWRWVRLAVLALIATIALIAVLAVVVQRFPTRLKASAGGEAQPLHTAPHQIHLHRLDTDTQPNEKGIASVNFSGASASSVAASLNRGNTLRASVPAKAQQKAQLDELIRAWAASNEYVPLKPLGDPSRRFVVANDPAMSARLQAILPVLEIFNGVGVAQAGLQKPSFSSMALPGGSTRQVATDRLFAEQVQPLLNAYGQLRQSVYGALVMQTRLKPYLDARGVEDGCVGSDAESNANNDACGRICA